MVRVDHHHEGDNGSRDGRTQQCQTVVTIAEANRHIPETEQPEDERYADREDPHINLLGCRELPTAQEPGGLLLEVLDLAIVADDRFEVLPVLGPLERCQLDHLAVLVADLEGLLERHGAGRIRGRGGLPEAGELTVDEHGVVAEPDGFVFRQCSALGGSVLVEEFEVPRAWWCRKLLGFAGVGLVVGVDRDPELLEECLVVAGHGAEDELDGIETRIRRVAVEHTTDGVANRDHELHLGVLVLVVG